MVHRTQWMACVIRQYGTGVFRSCVSLGGGSSLCLIATPEESVACEIITRFLDAQSKGEIRTLKDIISFRDGIRDAPVESIAA